MDALLAAMHARFRGSRELIAERLRVYLPLLEQAAAGAIHPVLLDLGSGRGELLELAQQYGWRARGAETNQAFVSECRQRGLDVLREEAVSCMRSLPAGSVRAVAALHLIEHLPFAHFVTLVDEAARVLAPGGVLLLETPNPDNLRVSTCTFHCDPTHQRPLPSAVVTFVVEARGLCRPQVLALHPADTAASEAMDAPAQLAEWLSGPQDYAVVAWKA
jgi:SAM-dependent methyltransferase